MKTIILPGFSPHNKIWADDVAKYLGKESFVHNWLHWETGKSNLNLKEELRNIVKEIGQEKINVIAKSVGTKICMHLLILVPNKIEKIILCGIPSVSEERKKLFKTSLLSFNPKNIIVFQNTKDPFASFIKIKKFMQDVKSDIKILEKERSDHNYPYFEDFKNFLN